MVDSSKAGKPFILLMALFVGLSAQAEGEMGVKPHPAVPESHFVTSDQCLACHNGLITPSGKNVSIGTDWRTTMMANSARDPYWQAAVRREATDHPESSGAIQNECSACHMPMARYDMKAAGAAERVFDHLVPANPTPHDLLAIDGVSCSMCHQITDAKLGTEESFTAGFVVTTKLPIGQREILGPYEVDPGRTRIMHSASRFIPQQAEHLNTSEVCATCHTLFTHALGPDGEVLASLPEQVPYLEWRHSEFAGRRSCQSCHMAAVQEETAITSVLGQPRPKVNQHVFRGGNFFMMRILNRYRDELNVPAKPAELDTAAMRTIEHLQTEAARIEVSDPVIRDGELQFDVTVRNEAGHKLPTAYPSRRAWLHVTVRDRDGEVTFESGAIEPDGSIRGNDNDGDPREYEPHYETITEFGQVQIYESIMADSDDVVTTGLLRAVRFLKDNRITPRGFDKAIADEDIMVRGAAFDDDDFTAGQDTVRYRIPVGEADDLSVEAALLYQPIAYRWAKNLGSVDATETRRFVSYYDEMSEYSWIELARTVVSMPATRTRTEN